MVHFGHEKQVTWEWPLTRSQNRIRLTRKIIYCPERLKWCSFSLNYYNNQIFFSKFEVEHSQNRNMLFQFINSFPIYIHCYIFGNRNQYMNILFSLGCDTLSQIVYICRKFNEIFNSWWRNDMEKHFFCTSRLYPYPSGPCRIWVNVSHDSVGKYEDFGARSRHMGPGKVITSHNILWDVITYSCIWHTCIWRHSPHTQIAKFMGPTWGPPGPCRPQMGPMLAPWTLQSGYSITEPKQKVAKSYAYFMGYTVCM